MVRDVYKIRLVWRLAVMVLGLAALLALSSESYRIVLGVPALAGLVAFACVRGMLDRLTNLSTNLLQANIDIAQVLGAATAKRDGDTSEHNFRVTVISVRIAERLQLDPRTIRSLVKGALVHDVGKIAIRDNILLKPGSLTAREFEVMKTHVREGVDIVARSGWLAQAREVVEHHHERFDGTGYLGGLKGKEIPLVARIFAVADVFDALTSRRPYKEPLEFAAAMRVLEAGRGRHFDPDVLDAFAPIARDVYRALADSRASDLLRDIVAEYFSHPADEFAA